MSQLHWFEGINWQTTPMGSIGWTYVAMVLLVIIEIRIVFKIWKSFK